MGLLKRLEPYQQLEQEYGNFVGSRYAVSCNSGSSALHLALLALGVGKDDEVIVPDFTMAACVFAVLYVGAKPVFADVALDTYSILPSEVERLITKKTKAIMVVHVYGRLAPMEKIVKIARTHGIPVLEDACEAQGAVQRSLADITAYSFYRNKIIHAEEGGMLTTNKRSIVERANYLKNMAFGPAHDYFHKEVGYNYRMSNSQAMLALESLADYKNNHKKRRAIETWYTSRLLTQMNSRDAVWFYELFVPAKAKRKILKQIKSARDCFKPLSSFPMCGGEALCPNAIKLSQALILLPAAPHLSKKDVENISDIVNKHGQFDSSIHL
jgi:perosamine synthetase